MSKFFSLLSLFLVATSFATNSYAVDSRVSNGKFEPKEVVKELNPYVSFRYEISDFVGWSDKNLQNWLSADQFKVNLLYSSIYSKNDKLARYLLNRGLNPFALNSKSSVYNYFNALGYATVMCQENDVNLQDAVESMIYDAAKYSKDEVRKGLAVALWMTIDSGNDKMTKYLSERGAQSPIDKEIMVVYVNAIRNGDLDKLTKAIEYQTDNKKKQLLKDSLYAAALWYENIFGPNEKITISRKLKNLGAKESFYSYLTKPRDNGVSDDYVVKKLSKMLLNLTPEKKQVNMLEAFGFDPVVWSLSSKDSTKVGVVKELTSSDFSEMFNVAICGEKFTPSSLIIRSCAEKVSNKDEISSNEAILFSYLKENGAIMLLTPVQAMKYKEIAMKNDSAELLAMITNCKIKLSNSEVVIQSKILADWFLESILLKKNKIAKMLLKKELPIEEKMNVSVMFPQQGGNHPLRATVGYLNIEFAKYLIAEGYALNLDKRDILEFIQFMGIVAKTSKSDDAMKMLDVLKMYLKQLEDLEKQEAAKNKFRPF
ncbi:hypothetical protein AAEX28_02610 [Lentisphaerota bacterium WC36G]|nr:hypothetical protein LJT99_05495 [Lentisphaerae bacterium WC36]